MGTARCWVRTQSRAAPAALRLAGAGLLAGFLILGACGGDDDSDEIGATSTTAGEAEGSATIGGSAAGVERVNANTASVEEMTAAFEAAGVENAERWAEEVEEYRPYEDDGWAHLRDELSDYNIDDETFEQIISVLEL